MDQKQSPWQAPAICIWGPQADLGEAWLAQLRSRVPQGSRLLLAADGTSHDALESLACDGSPLGALLAAQESGLPCLILLRAGCECPVDWVSRLCRTAEANPLSIAVSPLSSADAELVPLPAGERIDDVNVDRLDRLLFLHSERTPFPHHRATPEASLWNLERLRLLMEAQPESVPNSWASLEANCDEAEGLLACDHVYVHLSGPLVAADPPPHHQSPSPARALDAIAANVFDHYVQADARLPAVGLDQIPVQLHVLHSWGGGVAKWVQELSESQGDRHHLMLVAWGRPEDPDRGQELRLYAGSTRGTPLRRWPLPRSVRSTDGHNQGYQAILQHIIEFYCVDQLVISSLIGHSLDALKTGLPTLVVFHDYYPAWPVLRVQMESQSGFGSTELDQALTEPDSTRLFPGRSAAHWMRLRGAYLQALEGDQIRLAAPSESVRVNLTRIDPAFGELAIELIPHGFDGWDTISYQYQHPEADLQRRLRVVVPGRISRGKGQRLLAAAIGGLREHADVYLLGAGKDGETFFGTAGVHIVPDYDIDDLPRLMADIQPDLGLLLSTVSETFSYTLSEMRVLGIPVMATRVGSLAERIRHGVDGWLTDPVPEALIENIGTLRREPALIAEVAQGMTAGTGMDRKTMAQQYSQLLPAKPCAAFRYPLCTPGHQQMLTADAARQAHQLLRSGETQSRRITSQQQELDRRADWAFRLSRQLEDRTRWARELDEDLAETRSAIDALRNEFEDRTAWALKLEEEVELRIGHIRAQQAEIAELSIIAERHEQVIASRSWRLTKPLRFAARSARKLADRLGYKSRRAATLARRTQNSLKVRGLGGTLDRIRQELREPASHSTPVTVPDTNVSFEALSFPEVDDPTVSIVIPVYNQYRHTYGCLRSILDARCGLSFEVVVVDDASSDETAEELAGMTGITVLNNDENLGFIGTCNRGAEAARGEYLVFLNNDTAVADGWLDALFALFGRYPDAGLVGAKLVYPDGRLQEAGGIIFSDGSGWNYGRFENPDHPSYNFVREVDYCSGACIMIAAELFATLGGFDGHYAPAYYEDTDLAFKIREAGLKVYYQPEAVVTHFEGVTSGTDTSSGTKRYQVVNQEKFLERWKDVLETHPAPGTPIASARQHRRHRQALIIDATTPTPDQDSGSVRMLNLMTLLGELGYQVSFFADNRAWVETYTEALQQRGVEVWYHPHFESPGELLSEIGPGLNAVFVSRHYIARNYIDLIRRHCPGARLLFDTVDLHFLRERRMAELENDDRLRKLSEQTRGDELSVARDSDVTLVVSPFEKDVLAREAPDIDVCVLSNIHPVVGRRKDFSERQDLFFVGGFQHPPNIDAVRWFVSDIFPLVRRQLPEIRFFIVGSKAPPELRRLGGNGVEFKGFVHDLDPYLDDCRLAMAPLRYGAGVKGKVNMSMSFGQPVIATPTAIEGMYAESGVDVMVGADAAEFANAVVTAYQDEALWTTLSDNGLKNVERHFSFAAARRALQDILG